MSVYTVLVTTWVLKFTRKFENFWENQFHDARLAESLFDTTM